MRAEHNIHKGEFFAKPLRCPFLLGHTSPDRYQKSGVASFQLFQRSDVSVSMVFRIFADTAGIEDDNIRFLLVFAFFIAARTQNSCDFFRFMYVHLAAVCYDQILLFHPSFH